MDEKRAAAREGRGCDFAAHFAATHPDISKPPMAAGEASLATLGFLTVVEHAEHGLFGGYLVLNHAGRPLEFHCTTPVKANRAQEILYGPTLKPYLYGELIAAALVRKGKISPRVVLTDKAHVLAAQGHVSSPLALLQEEAPGGENPPDSTADVGDENDGQERGGRTAACASILRRDLPHSGPSLAVFRWSRYRLAVNAAHDSSRERVVAGLMEAGDDLDLFEPFDRIREALQEAQPN